MTQLIELPSELLSIIITFLAVSSNGGRDLVRASATCKKLLNIARRPEILRITSCESIVLRGFCEPHHRIDGLVSRCVRAGNPIAEHILAMVMLLGGSELWMKFMVSELQLRSIRCATNVPLLDRRSIAKSFNTGSIADLPYIIFSSGDRNIYEPYIRMRLLRILRLFISRASTKLLHMFCHQLKDLIVFFVGYEKARESGILETFDDMFINEAFIMEGFDVRMYPSAKDELLMGLDKLFLSSGFLCDVFSLV